MQFKRLPEDVSAPPPAKPSPADFLRLANTLKPSSLQRNDRFRELSTVEEPWA